IGIARALYYDPEILVFDEATSSLDNITEQAVMDALHNVGEKKTVIIVAHRITTVKKCDQIFILENGEITGAGGYQDLMNSSDVFREMVQVSD
ncbi:MAG: ABC transporter ATP-binding protein, partial [Candidatus Marinimicrobia bacterium]|nr:ABC transporter ATP-binding protein [Candidatus Neomarinimicrobiota bacterium]